jgi:hypothetical protein
MGRMTETTFKVLLQELTTARILCRKRGCKGVIELPIEQLGRLQFDVARCPVCGQELVPLAAFNMAGGNDPLPVLCKAIEIVKSLKSEFEIEFPIVLESSRDAE